jgi:tetratricopeptide (TPR) repeat protein
MQAAYNNMGKAYYDLENYREAIKCYQNAIAIDPNHAKAYNNMGYTYGNFLGNKQEQIKCCRQAAKLGHQDAQKWLQNNGYSW